MQTQKLHRFLLLARISLAYIIFVILWGAFVRATGSGAGCGDHWPLCNGEVIPRAPSLATVIELTHRVTSGLSLFLVGALVWQAFRLFPKGAAPRLGAVLSAIFLVIEAGIGAGLVLLELVAKDDSTMRAVAMAGHLVNTFLLLGALSYTSWAAQKLARGEPERRFAAKPALAGGLLLGLALFLAVGASGAIVALGDTLFRVSSLAEGFRQDFSPTAHALIKLRIWHPMLAILTALYLLVLVFGIRARSREPQVRDAAGWVAWVVLTQVALGTLNLVLLAPTWLQIVHLLMADAVWIVLLRFVLEAATVPAAARSPRDSPASAPEFA